MAYMCKRFYGRECDACGDCRPNQKYYCPVCDRIELLKGGGK